MIATALVGAALLSPATGRGEPSGGDEERAEPPAQSAPARAKSSGASAKASEAPVDTEKPALPGWVNVEGDAPVLVYGGAEGVRRALVYLHGRCGHAESLSSWAPDASKQATVIAPSGDHLCKNGGRYWGYHPERLHERIQRALDAVADLRGGAFTEVVVMGYSEGAARAELLPRAHPEDYPLLILAAGPKRPHRWRLQPAHAVVVLGGERDRTSHLREGLRHMLAAGQQATYLELPKAHHGEFGPDGSRVVSEALSWLFSREREVSPEPVPN